MKTTLNCPYAAFYVGGFNRNHGIYGFSFSKRRAKIIAAVRAQQDYYQALIKVNYPTPFREMLAGIRGANQPATEICLINVGREITSHAIQV